MLKPKIAALDDGAVTLCARLVQQFDARRSIAIDCKFKPPARLQLAGAALDGVDHADR
jgi:hypothetical protein